MSGHKIRARPHPFIGVGRGLIGNKCIKPLADQRVFYIDLPFNAVNSDKIHNMEAIIGLDDSRVSDFASRINTPIKKFGNKITTG